MKKYLCLHHSAVKATKTPQLHAVNRYHKDKWGMKSSLGWYVGYNYFIDVDGTLTQTRSWSEETVAQVGHNCDTPERCDTISVCMAGNFNINYVGHMFNGGEGQTEAFERLITAIKKQYPKIKVVGHRDLQKGRTCPGANIEKEEFKDWNKLPLNDKEDEEKEKKIKELQTAIDSLRGLLARLIKIINGKK